MSAANAPTCQPCACTVPKNPAGLRLEFRQAIRHQDARVREVRRHELIDRRGRAEVRETHGAAHGKKQRRGEAAVHVRQRDQHITAARPDVQRLSIQALAAARPRWNRQLLVAVLEVALARLDQPAFGHAPAHHRASSVGGHQGPHRDLDDAVTAQILELRHAVVEIHMLQTMLEFHANPTLPQGDAEQRLIEPLSRDRVDDFTGPLSVGLQRARSLARVNESAAHRHQRALDFSEDAGDREGVYATVRQRQIDGSAGFAGAASRIGAAFIERHPQAAAREENREQRARGTRADDGSRIARECHESTARASASTARKTS